MTSTYLSLLPHDESGHSFDNVTVGELSLVRGAEDQPVGHGESRERSPGGDTVTLPPDLTQADRNSEETAAVLRKVMSAAGVSTVVEPEALAGRAVRYQE